MIVDGRADPPVGSVDKALALIELLAEAGPDGMALRQVVEASGLNKASAHRTLQALQYRGFAEQGTDQRYRLGSRPALRVERFLREENADPIPPRFGRHLSRSPGVGAPRHPRGAQRALSRQGRARPHAPHMVPGRPSGQRADHGLQRAIGDRRRHARFAAVGVRGRRRRPVAERFRRAISEAKLRIRTEREENEAGICCVGVAAHTDRPPGAQ